MQRSVVPEAALEALADQNIPFIVKGKTSINGLTTLGRGRSHASILLHAPAVGFDG